MEDGMYLGCLEGWEQGIGVHMIKHIDGLCEAVKE